jgi:hypothetical protein
MLRADTYIGTDGCHRRELYIEVEKALRRPVRVGWDNLSTHYRQNPVVITTRYHT